jgi:hypothetical protein
VKREKRGDDVLKNENGHWTSLSTREKEKLNNSCLLFSR